MAKPRAAPVTRLATGTVDDRLDVVVARLDGTATGPALVGDQLALQVCGCAGECECEAAPGGK